MSYSYSKALYCNEYNPTFKNFLLADGIAHRPIYVQRSNCYSIVSLRAHKYHA